MHCHFHRVDRVPGFFSSRPNWLPRPAPSPASECCPPSPFGFKWGGGDGQWAHSLAGEGARGANSDEGTDTLVL
jgi:hypothetical protein